MPDAEPTIAEIAQTVLQDALSTIIHEVVLHRHREHKLLLQTLDPATKLPHCDTCRLPRLLDPPLAPSVRGAASDPPASTTYCDRKPWSRKPGHDIYGNPFLRSDVTGRPLTKKEREAAKNSSKKDGDNNGDGTPASQDAGEDGTGPPSPQEGGEAAPKLEKGEKKASKIDEKLRKGEYVPWHTCPNCKRSLLITRFAKHLEQCMGLSGRAASRNAIAKMNGTPASSRAGTPVPSLDGAAARKDAADDEDEETPGAKNGSANGGVRKKLLKKSLKEKAKKEKEKEKVPKSAAAAKRPPKLAAATNGVSGDGKREREEVEDGENDGIHVKKRQKLQRVGSTTSVVSQSTAGPDLEIPESHDGSSFVREGSYRDE